MGAGNAGVFPCVIFADWFAIVAGKRSTMKKRKGKCHIMFCQQQHFMYGRVFQPQYTSSSYEMDNTSFFVLRGLEYHQQLLYQFPPKSCFLVCLPTIPPYSNERHAKIDMGNILTQNVHMSYLQ